MEVVVWRREGVAVDPDGCVEWDWFPVKMSYTDYLGTWDWKKRRDPVLRRDGNRCRLCNRPAQVVHHRTYDRIGEEETDDLTALCWDCHSVFHEHRDLG
jgi:5-methylcytosine-specific restriction endonuclease McrA